MCYRFINKKDEDEGEGEDARAAARTQTEAADADLIKAEFVVDRLTARMRELTQWLSDSGYPQLVNLKL
jgi:hypothetical protein